MPGLSPAHRGLRCGPGEIRVLCAAKGVYQHFGVDIRPFSPASATVVEKRIAKVMDKYRLDFCDAFSDFEVIMKQALAAVNPENIPGEF